MPRLAINGNRLKEKTLASLLLRVCAQYPTHLLNRSIKLENLNGITIYSPFMMTLNDILQWGASRFETANLYFGHGTDNAWDEAVWLASHILNLPPDADRKLLTRELSLYEMTAIRNLYGKRIATRKPAAYLVNEAWFAGQKFYVDERVIVPRSPIAELIAAHFKPWIKLSQVKNILDLCTGSACIAIACAKQFPNAQVDASDISEAALEVAKINVEKHSSSVHLYQSDLFKALPIKKYDIIISNPPYVDAEDMAALPQEYNAEPRLALAAGKDGLRLVDKILKQAKNYLSDEGILIVEVGNSEAALVAKYSQVSFVWLEFKQGGQGVFLLKAEDLKNF